MVAVGHWVGNQLATFDAESKSVKIPNSLYSGGQGGVGQILMPSPNLLKSQKPFMVDTGGW